MTGEGLDPPATTSTLFDVSSPRPFDDHNQEIPARVFNGTSKPLKIMILSNKNHESGRQGDYIYTYCQCPIYIYVYVSISFQQIYIYIQDYVQIHITKL